ncbi:hypothetical protein QE152_g5641 [Popillia japonica]|uniref:Uncharacterized protein n=1 Tax=Popillia japonica TaxID=7064 RepID=A0AAW1MLZ9_POPJA
MVVQFRQSMNICFTSKGILNRKVFQKVFGSAADTGTFRSSKIVSKRKSGVNAEIQEAILNVVEETEEPYKSPGEDGFFPTLMQHGSEMLLPNLTKLIRASFAPGEDGFFPTLMQHGSEMLLPNLTKLIRASFAHGYIPQVWQTTGQRTCLNPIAP